MATLPTIESILFEAYRAAGLNILPGCGGQKLGSVQKERFIKRDLSLDVYQQRYHELVMSLLEALGSETDGELNSDLFDSLCEFHGLSGYLERSVWTYNASEQQVVWTVLACCYVPWIARKAGFWQREIELAKEIPGGEFWYLPQPSPLNANVLELPVAQVCRWLLSLLGVETAYAISELEAKALGGENTGDRFEDKKEPLRRSLYNWLGGETISANSINRYFADDSEFALEIREEDGSLISWRSIRHKFLYARLIQETYTKLVSQLCPGIDHRCVDPAKNKVVQLIELYKQIYQWTKDSYDGEKSLYSQTEHEQADQRFIAELQKHPRAFELNQFDRPNELADPSLTAELITEILKTQSDTDALQDIEPWDDASSLRISASSESLKVTLLSRRDETDNLRYQVIHRDPKQAITASTSPAALLSLFNVEVIPWRLKQLALKRLDNLKLSNWEQMHRIVVELSLYLNDHAQKNRKETQGRVDWLLAQASNHPKADAFKAPILQYQAKHRLSQNHLADAEKLFTQALAACEENGYGPLKGDIARDLFALSLVGQNLGKTHEKWFRILIFENTFEPHEHSSIGRTDVMMHQLQQRQPPTFEDTAVECADFFWDTLYRPYAGTTKLLSGLEEQGSAFKQLLQNIFAEDWQSFSAWISKNPELAKGRFRDVRGQTLLIILINLRHSIIERRQMAARFGLPPNPEPEIMIQRLEDAISILIDALPKKSVNMNDYKKQSPLMLAANTHIPDIVAMLINKGADLDQQDFTGRTAMHCAAVAGSDESFGLLIEAGASPEKPTLDGMTALHTAVRCGRSRMVKRLLDSFPSLSSVRDHNQMLPEDYIGINKLEEWKQFAKEHGRQMGTDQDYLEVAQLFDKRERSILAH